MGPGHLDPHSAVCMPFSRTCESRGSYAEVCVNKRCHEELMPIGVPRNVLGANNPPKEWHAFVNRCPDPR